MAETAAAPVSTRSASPIAGRLQALDAVRGVASLSVVFFHIYCFSKLPELMNLPTWLDWPLRHGSLGVEVFFVLSGVVITLAVAHDRISPSYVGRFALRRSIRLDPPYWATLVIACILLSVNGTPPPLGSMLAHVGYLQNLLGYRNIVSQYWTLCYEVQFYLVLVTMVGLTQRFGRRFGLLGFSTLFVMSLWFVAAQIDNHGWFIGYWYSFSAGAATAAMLLRKLNTWVWLSVVAAVFAMGIWQESLPTSTVAFAALAIGIAGNAGKLVTWSGGPILQWLGRISYSLYLIHFLGSTVAKMGSARVHSALGGWLVFLAATLVALVAAELMYRFLERPTQRFSRRVDLAPGGRLMRSVAQA